MRDNTSAIDMYKTDCLFSEQEIEITFQKDQYIGRVCRKISSVEKGLKVLQQAADLRYVYLTENTSGNYAGLRFSSEESCWIINLTDPKTGKTIVFKRKSWHDMSRYIVSVRIISQKEIDNAE